MGWELHGKSEKGNLYSLLSKLFVSGNYSSKPYQDNMQADRCSYGESRLLRQSTPGRHSLKE